VGVSRQAGRLPGTLAARPGELARQRLGRRTECPAGQPLQRLRALLALVVSAPARAGRDLALGRRLLLGGQARPAQAARRGNRLPVLGPRLRPLLQLPRGDAVEQIHLVLQRTEIICQALLSCVLMAVKAEN